MSSHRDEFPIEMMARVLDVSRTGFYAYARRGVSKRDKNRQRLDIEVHTEFVKSRKNYGAIRIKNALENRGILCDKKTIAKSLKRQDLKPKKFDFSFNQAVNLRTFSRGLIVHSDRGVQYCCDAFKSALKLYGVTQSMSRKGNCWDNAVSESFFSTLKKEMLGDYVFTNIADANNKIFDYIEVFYNRQRLHSANNYVSPVDAEEIKRRKVA